MPLNRAALQKKTGTSILKTWKPNSEPWRLTPLKQLLVQGWPGSLFGGLLLLCGRQPHRIYKVIHNWQMQLVLLLLLGGELHRWNTFKSRICGRAKKKCIQPHLWHLWQGAKNHFVPKNGQPQPRWRKHCDKQLLGGGRAAWMKVLLNLCLTLNVRGCARYLLYVLYFWRCNVESGTGSGTLFLSVCDVSDVHVVRVNLP